uniref:Uncharacterized protein n=1 Tax=Arundo donax TaxID=35708 RepID=A0A0A8YSN3_ARUDO
MLRAICKHAEIVVFWDMSLHLNYSQSHPIL